MAAATGTSPAVMDPQAECWLAQIPLEILIRITYFVSTPDLGSMRLSCKALEQRLFNFFSHEFFRKKQFMASTDSLQALIDISNHPTLSPFLKHVIIATDRPSRPAWSQDRNDPPRALFEVATADHTHLLASGGLRDMLAEAFACLSNLETVDIRDFNAESRTRDGQRAQWRSYGVVTLGNSTRSMPDLGPRIDHDPYLDELFMAVTAALAAAQARPKSLEVLVRNKKASIFGLHDTAFYIPRRLEPAMAPLLNGLRSLHLTLALSHPAKMRPFMFQKFLTLTPNLTWLRLNFVRTDPASIHDVLSWLAFKDGAAPLASIDSPPITLCHLERIDLGDAVLTGKALLSLVSKFASSLTSLYLHRVCLTGSDDGGGTAGATKVNAWVPCLSAMARIPGLGLRAVNFNQLQHSTGGWQRYFVSFKVAEGAPLAASWTCSTRVLTLDKALAQASAAMVAIWPPEPDPNAMDGTFERRDACCLMVSVANGVLQRTTRMRTRKRKRRTRTRTRKRTRMNENWGELERTNLAARCFRLVAVLGVGTLYRRMASFDTQFTIPRRYHVFTSLCSTTPTGQGICQRSRRPRRNRASPTI